MSHDLSELRLRAEGPARFRPGQYALFDHPDVAGLRAYSMCNLPNDEGEWCFQIKRVPGGALTTRLFDELRPGDTVSIDAPYGLAFLREDPPRDLVLIAGGSGLSPMVSIARAAVRSPALAARRISFFYGGRGPDDMCAEAILRDLPGFGDRIRYFGSISDPSLDPDARWQGAQGFIHDLVADTLGDDLPTHEIYFAGPPPMIAAVIQMLRARKVPLAQAHWDNFY